MSFIPFLIIPSPMPCDLNNKYWVRSAYQDCTISCMTQASYPRSRVSTHYNATPYHTPMKMIARIDDGPGQAWYHNTANNLHLCNFIFHMHMQTARYIQERTERFSD